MVSINEIVRRNTDPGKLNLAESVDITQTSIHKIAGSVFGFREFHPSPFLLGLTFHNSCNLIISGHRSLLPRGACHSDTNVNLVRHATCRSDFSGIRDCLAPE